MHLRGRGQMSQEGRERPSSTFLRDPAFVSYLSLARQAVTFILLP